MFHLHDLLRQKKEEAHWIPLDPTRGIGSTLVRPMGFYYWHVFALVNCAVLLQRLDMLPSQAIHNV